MEVSPAGMVTVVSALAPLKVFAPMEVTPAGMVNVIVAPELVAVMPGPVAVTMISRGDVAKAT